MHRPTAEEITAAQTPRGGWTRDQLAQWGVPWPPPKGWRRRLSGYSIPMTDKKNTEDKPTGTKQETADDSHLGKKPTSTPDDKGPERPADSQYS